MKILLVIENYLPHIGGVEILFRNLSEGLVKQGHEVTVVTHRLKETKSYEEIKGVKVHRVSVPPFGQRYFFTFLALPKVLSLAKEADIVHTSTFNAAPPAWLASRIRKKPCVLTVHEVWLNRWKEYTRMPLPWCLLHEFLERLIYSLQFEVYACDSESTRRNFIKAVGKREKAVTIYSGLDYETFNPIKARGNFRKKLGLVKNFMYFAYGRPGVSKGFEYLIKAVPMISEKIPNSKLLMILSKDKAYIKMYSRLVSLVKELGIKDRVILLEPVPYPELPKYLNTADCVVVPSITEGFGYTAAEASAMERPIVASNTTSLPEIVSGRFVLVEPKNPEAIAIGVEMVHNKHYIRTPKKFFLIKDFVEKYIRVYKRLLNDIQ